MEEVNREEEKSTGKRRKLTGKRRTKSTGKIRKAYFGKNYEEVKDEGKKREMMNKRRKAAKNMKTMRIRVGESLFR